MRLMDKIQQRHFSSCNSQMPANAKRTDKTAVEGISAVQTWILRHPLRALMYSSPPLSDTYASVPSAALWSLVSLLRALTVLKVVT